MQDKKITQSKKTLPSSLLNLKTTPFEAHSPPSLKKTLPSRYAVNEKTIPFKYDAPQVLHDLQQNVKDFDIQRTNLKKKLKDLKSIQPMIKRLKQPHQFKSKPIKRNQSDLQMFKQIFVEPKQTILKTLKEKKEQQLDMNFKSAKDYDKILNIIEDKGKTINSQINIKNINQAIDILKEQNKQIISQNPFFNQQIEVQPPDMPNASNASVLTPGNGYAPSIPLIHMLKLGKNSIKDLLVRAKAGMHANDLQKQAHLSFFLGMVYESNKDYGQAVKFYKKFLTCAKNMEDKIGMALGSNRVAINEFNRGNIQKSKLFHQKNLKLSDVQNIFAGYYNIGICQRNLGKFNQAINCFENGLNWALQRDEFESQCLSHGQLGVTYFEMGQFEMAIQNFQKCFEQSKQLHNIRLQLDSLMYITKINSSRLEQNRQSSFNRCQQCSKILRDKKNFGICVCNLGIFKGQQTFESFKNQIQLPSNVQFIDCTQQDFIKEFQY